MLLSEEATYNALDTQFEGEPELSDGHRRKAVTEEQEVEMDRVMTHGL